MNRILMTAIAGLVALTATVVANDSLHATALRCEYLQDPLGIDDAKPRLMWRVESDQRGQKQTAYQILVASSPENLPSR